MNSGGVARIDVVAPIMGEFFLSCVLFRRMGPVLPIMFVGKGFGCLLLST